MYNIHSTSENHTTPVGWQDQPNLRGTYDILKSCLGTIVLLCWSSVCPNVPALGGGRFSKIRGKLSLFLLAIFMPEAVLWVAVGQLHNARRDKSAFKALNSSGWGLRECFFVNMGGLFIRFGESDSTTTEATQRQPFPVNCTQLRYLVDEGFVDLPTISLEQIEMRNKSNGLAKIITIGQALWFTISTVARAAQGLPVTTLELTTVSMVFIMGFSVMAWWHKPMDISYPIIIECDFPLSIVLVRINDPPNIRSRYFGATPLSFHDREEWIASKAWASCLNILHFVYRGFENPPRKECTGARSFHNCFPSIEIFRAALVMEAAAGLLTQIYSCVLLWGWNSYFPSATELTLWRISSVTCIAYGFFGCAIAGLDLYGKVMLRKCHDLRRLFGKKSGGDNSMRLVTMADEEPGKNETKTKSWWRRIWSTPDWLIRLTNLSPYEDPELDMQLRFWVPCMLIAMVYCFARVFIIIEDFISLRWQPNTVYETVDWGQYSVLF